jgi:RNA-directed DNA polymerase
MFDAKSIRNCQEYIVSIQRRIDKAVADNDKSSIRQNFDILTKRSEAVRLYATWKITRNNKGKYTAGVDEVALPRERGIEEQNLFRLKMFQEIDISKKPNKIKRVYIPKTNGKKRPLGIPTIHDRIVQEIYRIALDPIVEYHFSNNSYGFRPKRSCHDAISHIYLKVARENRFRYVVEGDIKGCFDNINHQHILKTLEEWHTPNWAIEHIEKMLKSEIFHNGEVYDSETGTPQGGVISPMLANVALTSLDDFSKKFNKRSNPIIRYADDFIITVKSEKQGKDVKQEIADFLKEKIGLTLSEQKTHITHIRKGFDFLGFNVRKYQTHNTRTGEKLLIKPEKERVNSALREWSELIKTNIHAKPHILIKLLRPKVLGWAMYYRFAVSQRIFSKVDYTLWCKLHKWTKRRHPNKSKEWLIEKYFYYPKGNKTQIFYDEDTGERMPQIAELPIKRFVKVKEGKRVYNNDPDTIEYWKKREYTRLC